MRLVWGVIHILGLVCALGCHPAEKMQARRPDAADWQRLCECMGSCSPQLDVQASAAHAVPRLSKADWQAISRSLVHVEVSSRKSDVAQCQPNDGVRTTRADGGSGIITHSDGFILTNEHVVRGAGSIVVVLADGSRLPIQQVITHPSQDLALLRVSRSELPTLATGASGNCEGCSVIAGGRVSSSENSVGAGGLVTRTDASLQQLLDPQRRRKYEHLIESTAAIEPGFSGGPLLDHDGRLIGINVAMRQGPCGNRLAYAISLDDRVWAEIETLRALLLVDSPVPRADLCDSFDGMSWTAMTTFGVVLPF